MMCEYPYSFHWKASASCMFVVLLAMAPQVLLQPPIILLGQASSLETFLDGIDAKQQQQHHYEHYFSSKQRDETDGILLEEEESINFMAIGDWGGVGGGSPFEHPLLQIGHPAYQKNVSHGLVAVIANDALDHNRHLTKDYYKFIVALGDNFYQRGVSASQALSIERFNKTFESVYNHPLLLNIPWYVIAGNHDHFGDIENQIQYTYSKYNTNGRWNFPSLYHSHSFYSSTTSHTNNQAVVQVDVLLLDTIDLCSLSQFFPLHPLSSSTSPFRSIINKTMEANGGKQWVWLENQLSTSQADYIIVGGHYPMYSICRQGPTPILIQHLKPLLIKYNAQVYIAGHDHGMMHFEEEILPSDEATKQQPERRRDSEEEVGNAKASQKITYIVSGAGNTCCCKGYNKYKNYNNTWNLQPIDKYLKFKLIHENNVNKDVGGFVTFHANKKFMTIQHHNQDGTILYTSDEILPRTKERS